MGFGKYWTQFYPPKPKFTDKDVGSLAGKVYIITGSNTGVGKELAKMLYAKDAKVYVATRSKDKALAAIDDIKAAHPSSKGTLVFLALDLSDLVSVKASAAEFLSKETSLHVLWNNAGMMQMPEPGVPFAKLPRTAQGYEMCLGVNNVGPFLFTRLLTPVLVATAKAAAAPGEVRVVWISSGSAELIAPSPGGVDMANLDYHIEKDPMYRYGHSKAGNFLHSAEFAKRHTKDGVVSVAVNPGNLTSDLYRDQSAFFHFMLKTLILYPVVYGAYTELYAGLSPEVTLEKSGLWIVPWGRFMDIRTHLVEATKTKEEGGSGIAEAFWEWNEKQVQSYL